MSAYPKPYDPRRLPTVAGMDLYLNGELRAISETLAGVLDMIPKATNAAPERPKEGMFRLSLSPWRPVVGQTTDRWVIYNGTAWEYPA